MATTGKGNGYYTVKYLPFIENHTRKLYNRFAQRYDYEDLLSEATLAALLAEKIYKPEVSEFSSYIRKRIEGAVIRSVSSTSSKQQSLLMKIYKWVEDYTEKTEAIPSIDMALHATGINHGDYKKALASADNIYRVPMDEVVMVSEDMGEELNDVMDAVSRLPKKYNNAINNYLADRSYSQFTLKTAVIKIKDILDV